MSHLKCFVAHLKSEHTSDNYTLRYLFNHKTPQRHAISHLLIMHPSTPPPSPFSTDHSSSVSLILRITLLNIRNNLPLPLPRTETLTRNSTKQFLPSISTMKFILSTLSPSMRTLTLFAADMALRPIFTAAKRYLQLTPARHQPQTSKEQATEPCHCKNTQRQ